MGNYFTTICLHEGYLEMEILVHSAETIEEAENIGKSNRFHIGYLYDDRLLIKGENLTIKKEETDRYQFRVCRDNSKLMVRHEDFEDCTWEEAILFYTEAGEKSISQEDLSDCLIEKIRTLPLTLESLSYGVWEHHPFKK
ncbi:hypothetical protein [Bacillus velezensis]